MIDPRAKGKRFEQWAVNWFKDAGYIYARRSGLGFDGEDILGVPFYVECKHCEHWHLHEWIEKAKDRANGRSWVIIAKRNKEKPVIITELSDKVIKALEG